MPSDPLLSQRAADEALDVELISRRLIGLVRRALADGVVTPDEATSVLLCAEDVLIEAREAKVAADAAYAVDAALDTLRRGGALHPTAYKRERLRAAGIDLLVDEKVAP